MEFPQNCPASRFAAPAAADSLPCGAAFQEPVHCALANADVPCSRAHLRDGNGERDPAAPSRNEQPCSPRNRRGRRLARMLDDDLRVLACRRTRPFTWANSRAVANRPHFPRVGQLWLNCFRNESLDNSEMMHWRAAEVGGAALAALLTTALALSQVQLRNLRGQVVQDDGGPVASTNVRLVSFTENVTTPKGDFVLSIPAGLHPGDPVTLAVDGWVVRDPYQGGVPGGMFLPRNALAPIRVVVLPQSAAALKGDMVQRVAEQHAFSMVFVNSSARPRTFDQFAAAVAPRFKTEGPTVERAFNDWGEAAKDPYSAGLYSLMRDRFKDATNQLRKVETVPAQVALGLAQFRLEDFKGAEFNWSKANDRQPSNPIVMNNLAVARFRLRVADPKALLSDALAIAERANRTGQANVVRTNLKDVEAAR
jgi:hypothetical protein